MKNNKFLILVLVLVVIFGGLIAWYKMAPGQYDALAQCLTEERDVTFFGAFWCPHCAEQKQLFGKSAEQLPYVECSTPDRQGQLQVCEDEGIQGYPTWEFSDGSRVSRVMTPQELSERTNCPLN